MRRQAGFVCAALLALTFAATVQAQTGAVQTTPLRQGEMERLRAAQQAEADGDIVGAEAILVEMLVARPGSLSGILSIERLLRIQGRFEEALRHIEAFLAVDEHSPIGHQLALRTLSSMDRVDDLERAERRWIAATPDVETPYREAARIWEARGDAERALRVLREGRQRLGGAALAYEIGAVHAIAGEPQRAIEEWSRAIGHDAERFQLVERRLAKLPDGGAAITPGLVDRLRQPPTGVPRLRAALSLAIGAGLQERGMALAQQVYVLLEPRQRADFLLETGRAADASRQPRLAYWAFRSLLQVAPELAENDALRRRVSELALAVGDSATAREAAARIAAQAEPGSALARQADARRIELSLTAENLDQSIATYRAFRERFGDVPEVDRLAAVIGQQAVRARRMDDAASIVEGVRGPAAAHVRARVALHAGDPAAARAAFLTAATGLLGSEATEAIRWATMLARATPAGARRLDAALASLDAGDTEAALDSLTVPSLELRADERAALLDYAARLADGDGRSVRAESIRRTLIDEYPRAQEAAAALLGLARALAERPESLEEATSLLERLILEHPRSALVPQARRLLAEVGRLVPAS
ncbi:MAG TPA: hypothetical protein VMN78_10590 [Longimicrobiales bacterium]|nr:hypothetical protein [Longimicrobiales bacterium]